MPLAKASDLRAHEVLQGPASQHNSHTDNLSLRCNSLNVNMRASLMGPLGLNVPHPWGYPEGSGAEMEVPEGPHELSNLRLSLKASFKIGPESQNCRMPFAKASYLKAHEVLQGPASQHNNHTDNLSLRCKSLNVRPLRTGWPPGGTGPPRAPSLSIIRI